jgi:acetyl esterase/lipase
MNAAALPDIPRYLYLCGWTMSRAPCFVPLLNADDLRGLSPAHIAVASSDPIHDEALQFAARLLASGVSVELHLWPGTGHGFSQMNAMALAESAVLAQGQVQGQGLERALGAS